MATRATATVQVRNVITGDVDNITLSNVNPALFDTADAASLAAAYQRADTVGRAVAAMGTGTYVDTLIEFMTSVSEELAG